MSTYLILVKRNIKLFFNDKGMFFTSLITPVILLVLYMTFLKNIYQSNFTSQIPDMISIPDTLLDGLVAGQLISSILAVSSVTVAFCSNLLMIQDKVNGTIHDLTISPVKSTIISMSYFTATFISTVMITFVSTTICLIYVTTQGWYMSVMDVICLFLDVGLLSLFGTALSSIIHFFLSTQGQMSAVGTIVSAGYGFICGAYMPISSFSQGLQKVLSFLPGTYATSLIRNHSMQGVFTEMHHIGIPTSVIDGIKTTLDCQIYFNDIQVSIFYMYLILIGSIIVLMIIYILLNRIKK